MSRLVCVAAALIWCAGLSAQQAVPAQVVANQRELALVRALSAQHGIALARERRLLGEREALRVAEIEQLVEELRRQKRAAGQSRAQQAETQRKLECAGRGEFAP